MISRWTYLIQGRVIRKHQISAFVALGSFKGLFVFLVDCLHVDNQFDCLIFFCVLSSWIRNYWEIWYWLAKLHSQDQSCIKLMSNSLKTINLLNSKMHFIFHLGENTAIFKIVNMLGKIFIIQFQFIWWPPMWAGTLATAFDRQQHSAEPGSGRGSHLNQSGMIGGEKRHTVEESQRWVITND